MQHFAPALANFVPRREAWQTIGSGARKAARRAMKVREYLATLRRVIITCRPEDTIETAATLLATNHIGAMPVRDANGRIVGMFSERDIVRAFSQRGNEVGRLLVGDLMAARLIVCAPDDTMVTARKLMKANRIRHLLVMEDDQLVGLLSVTDVLEVILHDADMEMHVLRDHIIAVRGM
jgi:CBS domain-containing protein